MTKPKLRLVGGTAAVGRFACVACAERFADRRRLERHLQLVHGLESSG